MDMPENDTGLLGYTNEYLQVKPDILQNTVISLRKLLSDERLNPSQIVSIARIILAIGSPPGTNQGIDVFLDLSLTTPIYYCQIVIHPGGMIELAAGGASEGDSITDIDISISPNGFLPEQDMVRLITWESTFEDMVNHWSSIELIDNTNIQKINWDAWNF